MGTPFLGELKMFGYERNINGWAKASGQLLPINQNQALFSLLGVTYGGNGQTNFALPDLRSRVPMHFDTHTQGEKAGQESVTITIQTMPQHIHFFRGNTANADKDIVGAAVPPAGTLGSFNNGYRDPASLVALQASSVGNVGGSQPHQNMQPYLAINYMIALQGIFPSRN